MSKLNFILKDINKSLAEDIYSSRVGYEWKKYIKDELDAQFCPIVIMDRSGKQPIPQQIRERLRKQIDSPLCNIIYTRKIDYIYLLIEYLSVYESWDFDIYMYCEQRMCKKNAERNYLYNCLKSVHDKIVKLLKKDKYHRIASDMYHTAERIMLYNLLLREPSGEKDEVRKSNLLKIVADAENEALSAKEGREDDMAAVKEYTKLLVEEINAQW